jgi:hypothetical protein
MSIDESNFDRKVSLAQNSQDVTILKKLKNDLSAVIRKSVALNLHTTKDIIHELVFDPVLNVSYLATKHPNCSIQRKFTNTKHPCVRCKDDFINITNCNSCTKLSGFSY